MKNNLYVYGGEADKYNLTVLIRYNSFFGFFLKSDKVFFYKTEFTFFITDNLRFQMDFTEMTL